jgi:hypothetical protein
MTSFTFTTRSEAMADLAAVHQDVTMVDELTGGSDGSCRSRAWKTTLSKRVSKICSIVLAGDTAACAAPFHRRRGTGFSMQAVVIAELLLLDQAFAVFGGACGGTWAMDTGTIVAAFEILRVAKNRNAKTAADADAGPV